MKFAGFDWDAGNRAKCEKHGLSTNSIEAAFQSGLMILPDAAHSQTEQRFQAIGRDESGRPMFVAFTLRNRAAKLFIRPISARYMHKEEIEHYEKTYGA